jgi:pimeloyl-ACP methyl ester carboxylesterase
MEKIKETYIMIHSAWLGAWSLEYVKEALEKKAHKVITFDLPGHGQDETGVKDITMDSYVKATQKIIDAQDGKVILVGHSFGGMVISQVAQTRSSKIKKLVYLSAMLVPDGVSFLEAVAPVKTSIALNNLVFSKDKSYVTVKKDKLHEAFGADISLEIFKTTIPLLSSEPTAPLGAKIKLSNDKFGTIPRYYIQTMNDNGIPTPVQESMFTSMGIDKLYTISNSSHLPIFSHPELVANILDDISKQSAKKDISYSQKAIILKEVLKVSNTWKDGFNSGNAKQCANVYSADATMDAKPFGIYKGAKEIEAFWDQLIKNGFKNVEYINFSIEILDQKRALIKSNWKMNKAQGVITKELFEIQSNGNAKLIADYFEAI